MKKKVLALGLSMLFFGSMATSTFGMVFTHQNVVTVVDHDKKPKKNKKSNSKECTMKSECHSSAKSCDEKKSAKKTSGDKK